MTETESVAAPVTRKSITYARYGSPLWQRVFLTREFAVILAVIIVAIVASSSIPRFGTPLTLSYLLLDLTPVLIIALPMTLILISGEIDLSVASTVGVSNVVLGFLYAGGVPIELAMVICLAVGVFVGALNGFLVAVVGLPSLAVTIGTLALFRGIAVGILGTTSITTFPDFYKSLANANFPRTGIPLVMVLVAVLVITFALLLHFTPFGRGIFATGRAREVARFSGVRVKRTKFILFVLSGLLASVAGIYYTFRYGSSRGDNAVGLELTVIAAVLLGGVSIFGGRGALHGVIGGVVLIGLLQSALRFSNVTSDVINIVTGALLVASVVAPAVLVWLKGTISTRFIARPRSTRKVRLP
ncbi:ABC transporter permease [Glaciibacter flavus]|uniref:ABC transporter permease n=1 Tax=Orlajensenia flava TaxID=2565934 RepID=UPI003B00F152